LHQPPSVHLRAAELDIATNIPASQYARLESAAGVDVASVLGFSAKLVLLDALPDSPIADPRVRQAINLAVDKEALLDVLYDGHGQISTCQLGTPAFFGYNPDLEPYPYDPDRARQLLAEAGYPNGLTVDYKYRTSSGDGELTEAIAAMLGDVGIQVNHIVLEGGEFLRQLSAFELRNMATLGITTAPDTTYGHNIFRQAAPYSYYRNPAFDEVVAQASQALDPDERRALLGEAARIACEDPVALFLFSLEDIYGVSERVTGWSPSPDNLFYFEDVRLDCVPARPRRCAPVATSFAALATPWSSSWVLPPRPSSWPGARAIPGTSCCLSKRPRSRATPGG